MADFGLGVWVHSVYQLGDRDEIARHADRLADGGFDLLIPSVKNPPGYADFFTDVADVNPEYAEWDPLKVIIDECAERGIKVHPWFCIFPEGDASRLMREHPEAKATFDSRFPWACACQPVVQDYLFELYKSVAERYHPAGLHLDYIRTGGACQCDYCKAEMDKQGVDIGTVEYKDPDYQKWIEWRVQRITDFVRRVKQYTTAADLELSAAVFSNYPDCREQQGQDWVSWAEEGLVDFMFPMSYTNSVRMLRMRTIAHVAQLAGKVPLWEGLGKGSSGSALSGQIFEDQVKGALELGAQGVVIFSYPAVTDEDIAAVKKLR